MKTTNGETEMKRILVAAAAMTIASTAAIAQDNRLGDEIEGPELDIGNAMMDGNTITGVSAVATDVSFVVLEGDNDSLAVAKLQPGEYGNLTVGSAMAFDDMDGVQLALYEDLHRCGMLCHDPL